jgi:hypothetical protein
MLDESNGLEVQGVVGKEVKCEGNVVDGAPEDHTLGCFLMGSKTRLDACYKWNLFAETEYLSSV